MFPAFRLDQWLQQHAGAEFNLGGSTGPRWTPRQLLGLAGDSAAEKILILDLDYTPTPGSTSLREAIGNNPMGASGGYAPLPSRQLTSEQVRHYLPLHEKQGETTLC